MGEEFQEVKLSSFFSVYKNSHYFSFNHFPTILVGKKYIIFFFKFHDSSKIFMIADTLMLSAHKVQLDSHKQHTSGYTYGPIYTVSRCIIQIRNNCCLYFSK